MENFSPEQKHPQNQAKGHSEGLLCRETRIGCLTFCCYFSPAKIKLFPQFLEYYSVPEILALLYLTPAYSVCIWCDVSGMGASANGFPPSTSILPPPGLYWFIGALALCLVSYHISNGTILESPIEPTKRSSIGELSCIEHCLRSMSALPIGDSKV